MPHQCVRCGTLYEDGSSEILHGCSCGGKLFFYIKKKHLEEAREAVEKLTEKEKEEMEKDVMKVIDVKQEEKPVVLDFESIRVLKPGKYEIDLVKLFKNEPIIFKLEEGKYIIDLTTAFKALKKK